MAIREFTLCELEQIANGRWFIAKDMNCDGVFTISDVGLWAEWAFFLPGDGFLWALMQWQNIAIFLELTPAAYSGWISGIFSVIIWFLAMVIWAVLVVFFEDST